MGSQIATQICYLVGTQKASLIGKPAARPCSMTRSKREWSGSKFLEMMLKCCAVVLQISATV